MKVSTAQFGVSTSRRSQMLDITSQVQQALARSGAREGVVHVYVPHTTAGITVNENANNTTTVNVGAIGTFAANVTLSCSTLPAGFSCASFR